MFIILVTYASGQTQCFGTGQGRPYQSEEEVRTAARILAREHPVLDVSLLPLEAIPVPVGQRA